MKALFLYTELAGYFLKCCEELSKTAEVHIVHWPVNKEAPFKFAFPEGVRAVEKSAYTLKALRQYVKELSPDIIVCSGWIDRQYLSITRDYFGSIPTVVVSDTHWKGTAKQHLAVILSRFSLRRIFSHMWVPGRSQEKYARKLGFPGAAIRKGFYVCDLETFNQVHLQNKTIKHNHFPRRFLYVGRYYEFKGITDLWRAFINLQAEAPSGWELWCFGTGDVKPVQHDKIKHFGFVQPHELPKYLSDAGIFVLPSRYEPWGVVVQEFAAAGFPLLLSDKVGAGEAFLSGNGRIFPAGDVAALEQALKKMMELSGKELFLMAEKSHMLAQTISPVQWATTVTQIYDEFRKK